MCQLRAFILTSIVWSSCFGKFDPCLKLRCPYGEVCKLQRTICYTAPCPGPTGVCHPSHMVHTTRDQKHTLHHVPAVTRVKHGECARFTGSVLPFCQAQCFQDVDCPGKRKCCGVCPRMCTEPVKHSPHRKPRKCPKPTRIPGRCIASCMNDSECPNDMKCCGGCPRNCKHPI